MREGDDHVTGSDTSSLQVLGTVGEPINPEAWKWYHRVSAVALQPLADKLHICQFGINCAHSFAPRNGIKSSAV